MRTSHGRDTTTGIPDERRHPTTSCAQSQVLRGEPAPHHLSCGPLRRGRFTAAPHIRRSAVGAAQFRVAQLTAISCRNRRQEGLRIQIRLCTSYGNPNENVVCVHFESFPDAARVPSRRGVARHVVSAFRGVGAIMSLLTYKKHTLSSRCRAMDYQDMNKTYISRMLTQRTDFAVYCSWLEVGFEAGDGSRRVRELVHAPRCRALQ